MFLPLEHTKLDVYKVANEVILEAYQLMVQHPAEERYNLVSQIKSAALSIKLNIAKGASRKSAADRKRFYEIARGSVVELDSAIGVCIALGYLRLDNADSLGKLINTTYGMLCEMTSKD